MTKHEACSLLGVNEKDNPQQIKACYLNAVKQELKKENPSEERLRNYQEAYDSLYEYEMRTNCRLINKTGMQVIKVLIGVVVVIVSFMGVHQIDRHISNEDNHVESLSTWMLNKDESIHSLATSFQLTMGQFYESKPYDWLYHNLGDYWLVTVVVKVDQANDLGALLTLEQFYLEEDSSIKLSDKLVSTYEVLGAQHRLSEYYELIPVGHQFNVSFYTEPFEVGESRTIYFKYPTGEQIEIGILEYTPQSTTAKSIQNQIG